MRTPIERFLAALEQRECDPKQNGKGWSARCPAHDDRNPSLSIAEGDDGRALVRCHAGCSVDAVCDAVDLRVADLMNGDSSTASTSTKPRQTRGKRGLCRQDNGKPAGRAKRFQPFPTDAVPTPIRGFVEAGAKAIGCDPSYLALPMLTALAAAIGNTRQLQLKQGWTVPSIIWTAIVGESGTAKTPAFKLVMRPIRDRQRKALELHAEAMQQYEDDVAHYEKALSEWKRDKKTEEPPPTKPDLPQADRCIVSDTTVEALAPLLLANSRGLLLSRDELAGWLGSFDRYAGGKGGADAAHWLSMHAGDSIVVDRKTGNPRTIFVPNASMSITGGIQPSILHRALGTVHRESGLAARLLLTCPPRKAKRWTESDIDPDAEVEIAQLIERLYDLKSTVDDDGKLRPVVLGLTPDAKTAWKAYFNAHAQEQTDLTGELSAAWSKLEEYAARLDCQQQFTGRGECSGGG